MVGTPAYIPPEQAMGLGTADARSDIYSLGCVLFEMLAGRTRFGGRTPRSVMVRQMMEAPPSFDVLHPDTPVAIRAAIEKAVAFVPADRWASAADFADALRQSAPPVVSVRVDRWWFSGWLLNHRRAALLTVVTLLITSVAMIRVLPRNHLSANSLGPAPSRRVSARGPRRRGSDWHGEDIATTLTIALNSTQQIGKFSPAPARTESGEP